MNSKKQSQIFAATLQLEESSRIMSHQLSELKTYRMAQRPRNLVDLLTSQLACLDRDIAYVKDVLNTADKPADQPADQSVDQCKNCTVRGNLSECLKTPCIHHQNWMAMAFKDKLREVRDLLDATPGMTKHVAFCNEVDTLCGPNAARQ